MAGTPFASDRYALGADRAAREIELGPVAAGTANALGKTFSEIDPWNAYEMPAETLSAFLSKKQEGRHRFLIFAGDDTAGIVVVTVPWLFGPYLHFLGLVPEFQDAGIGTAVMDWFEAQAKGHFRNLWICVSAFNTDALRFYERFGYSRAATLDGLVMDGRDEILMRKRI